MNNIQMTDTTTLCSMAEVLKAEAKAAQTFNRGEAMRLFKLYLRITEELSQREQLNRVLQSQAYRYN
jgi:cyclopropane fatty-acyl-phospholipid synthase-like methyltransferase